MRFELTTFSLATKGSTTELRPHFGGDYRTRTDYLLLAKQSLYPGELNPHFILVRVEGLEPPHLTVPEPKSGASTNFAIPAL
jgi:hypothetical protein